MSEEERISWTVEGQTLELKTLEPQLTPLQIKAIPLYKLRNKCIVPYNKNKRSIDSRNRINNLKKIINNIRPIIVLEDNKGQIIRILDGNHRVRLYEDLGKKQIIAKIIKEGNLTDRQRSILMKRK